MLVNRKKKAQLTWFMDFMNCEVQHLSSGEVVKLWTEIDLILAGIPFGVGEPSLERYGTELLAEIRVSKSPSDHVERLGQFQVRLKGFFNRMMENLRELGIDKHAPPPDGAEIRWERRTLDSITSPMRVRFDVELPMAREMVERNEEKETVTFATWVCAKPDDLEFMKFRVTTWGGQSEDSFLVRFLYALDGVPLGVIRRCPECEKWFIHTTKRSREFCSNRCAARKASRVRREKLKKRKPKAYKKELREGAERARKSYVKKVKKEHPRAKVERRPRKHK